MSLILVDTHTKSHTSKHTGSRFYFSKLIYKDFIRCYLDRPHERQRDNHLLAVNGSHLRPQTPGWQKWWQLPLPEMCSEQPHLTRKGLFRLSVSQSLTWDWYWRISFCYHLPHTLARGHQLPISPVKCLHTCPVSSKPPGGNYVLSTLWAQNSFVLPKPNHRKNRRRKWRQWKGFSHCSL